MTDSDIERIGGLTKGERRFVRVIAACAVLSIFIAVLTDTAA